MGSKPKENSALQVEWRALDSIRPYPKNARNISQKAIDSVAKSITEFGWRQPIVVDVHGVIVIGHVRRLAAIQLTLLQVPVHVCDLPDAKIRALRLMDNRSHDEAQWDMEVLTAEMLELRGLDLDLGLTGFDVKEWGPILGEPQELSVSLSDRFIVPPFSVLDARQGYWQERKRAWLALGIKSELGRGGGTWRESATGSPIERQRAYVEG